MSTTSKTADAPTRALADGNHIPLLGFGVWQVPNGPTTVNAVRWALELPGIAADSRGQWASRCATTDSAGA